MQGAPLDPFPEGSAAAHLLLREQTFPGGTAQHTQITTDIKQILANII